MFHVINLKVPSRSSSGPPEAVYSFICLLLASSLSALSSPPFTCAYWNHIPIKLSAPKSQGSRLGKLKLRYPTILYLPGPMNMALQAHPSDQELQDIPPPRGFPASLGQGRLTSPE